MLGPRRARDIATLVSLIDAIIASIDLARPVCC
jgi:hypothetical protein